MDKQQREYIHHLMLQYSDAMVRLTYRRVGDWHLAEDLVQETFLTACCKSERVYLPILQLRKNEILMQFHISTIKKNSLLFQIGNG